MKNFILIFSLTLCTINYIWGQRTISGRILDPFGAPLEEASVFVMGAKVGGVTDVDGKYSLEIPGDSAVLKINYDSGWTIPEAPTGDQDVLNVVLIPYMPMKQPEESRKIEQIEQAATIWGRVFDERRKPLAGTAVWLGKDSASVHTLTDSNGYYELKIPPGPNAVYFNHDAKRSKIQVNVIASSYIEVYNLPLAVIDRWKRRFETLKKKSRKN